MSANCFLLSAPFVYNDLQIIKNKMEDKLQSTLDFNFDDNFNIDIESPLFSVHSNLCI